MSENIAKLPVEPELIYESGERMAEAEWIEIKARIDLAYALQKRIRLEVYP